MVSLFFWQSAVLKKNSRQEFSVIIGPTCFEIPLSAGHQRVPKSERYVNQSLPGGKTGETKGEVKRGKGLEEGTGLKGKEGVRERGNKGERKGARKHTRKL